MMEGRSSFVSIDNLYKSIANSSADKYFSSQEVKNNLIKPLPGPKYKANSRFYLLMKNVIQIILVMLNLMQQEMSLSTILPLLGAFLLLILHYKPTKKYMHPCSVWILIFNGASIKSKKDFSKFSSLYLVTDDLVVMPMSSLFGISFLKKSNVPLSDVEERNLRIVVKEGLSILKLLYSATNRLITAKDHASVQINIGHLGDKGIYNNQFSTLLSVVAQGDADSASDRLWQKKKVAACQQ
ncbi:40S ribosomal protein S21 [Quillaja saponaria]|uniref:40S ribosomal protein S21 n=1 Tax=Quillaja saponaria TaxID=32244 RepID=A0AAD7LNB9_QUISA|nr:40S ribosomal protein S21 [Quillaja saponaria]